jgi:hydroxypyruvate isomerase
MVFLVPLHGRRYRMRIAARKQRGSMHLIANISLMFTEVPLPQRFGAAARAGFDGVEIQFPYDVDAAILRDAAGELPVVLINVPASDGRGGIGRAVDAGQRDRFATGLDEARRFAETVGVRKVNVLAGAPPLGQSDAVTARILSDNVQLATEMMDAVGVEVVVEAINPFDSPGFWLDRLEKTLRFLHGQADPRVKLQFDFYHMSRTEPDLLAAIRRAGPMIGHVQFADHPGRHEPGTGAIDFPAAFAALREVGYSGPVAAEYRPRGRTEDGLAWMATLREWLVGPGA